MFFIFEVVRYVGGYVFIVIWSVVLRAVVARVNVAICKLTVVSCLTIVRLLGQKEYRIEKETKTSNNEKYNI